MHVSHLQMLAGGWLALALWSLHRYFTDHSRRALAAFAASYLLLALSCSYLLYFAAIPLSFAMAAGVKHAFSRTDRRAWWTFAELAVAALAIAAVLAPVADAYLRVRRATGLRRALPELAMYSAHWPDFLSIPSGLRAWANVLSVGMPERMLFPGVVVTLLALAAVLPRSMRAGRDRRWAVWMSAGAGAACVWLAFGPAGVAYRVFLGTVPGLDALRVPARIMVVATLPLALLAGRGMQVLGGRRSLIVSILSAAAIVVEGCGAPLPLIPFDAFQRERAPLNAWLRHSPPGGVLELPIAGPRFQPFTTRYQFNTLFHGHPIVNGYTGTGYGLQDFLGSPTSPVARVTDVPAALGGLRAIGVRYVVLHAAEYARWTGWKNEPLISAIDAEDGQVRARARFGDTFAWQLTDAPPPEARPLGRLRLASATVSASASHNSGQARLAFDDRVETKWTTAEPQHGDEWFEFGLPDVTDVSTLVFRTDRTGHSERPQHLVVESMADGGARRTLFDGSLVPSMIAAFAGLVPETAIGLPPNRSRALRLRQTGRGGRVSWSIHEVQIYAR
jgi:hypothetical protein